MLAGVHAAGDFTAAAVQPLLSGTGFRERDGRTQSSLRPGDLSGPAAPLRAGDLRVTCRCGCDQRARLATSSDTVATTRGTMNITGNHEINSSTKEDADYEMIRCCAMPSWFTGFMMILLCVVDLLHVGATMISMANLAQFFESAGTLNGSNEDVVVQENAKKCLYLYVIKVVTTLLLVVLRMSLCSKKGTIPDDNTNRWRANQHVSDIFGNNKSLSGFVSLAFSLPIRSLGSVVSGVSGLLR